ncbi:hypothetical protein LSH36_973g00002, partial [Paralvinella palmiformis]
QNCYVDDVYLQLLKCFATSGRSNRPKPPTGLPLTNRPTTKSSVIRISSRVMTQHLFVWQSSRY